MQQDGFFEEYLSLVNPPVRKLRSRGGPSGPKQPKEAKILTPEAKKERAIRTNFPTYANACSGCALEAYKKFTEVKGNLATCRLIVVLDRPSMQEIASGRAFSSPDIQFLEHSLVQVGVLPEQIAYIYALRCGCHDKEIGKDEVLRCGSYLMRDLAASPCRAVLNVSLIGTRYMFQGKSLKTFRGRVVEFNKKQVVCCQSLDVIQKDPIQGSLFQNDLRRLTQVLIGDYNAPEYKYISLTHPDEIVDMCRHLVQIYKPEDIYGWDIETMWLDSLRPYATDCYAEQFKIWQMAFAFSDFNAVGFPFHPDPFLMKKFNLPSVETHPEILVAVRALLEKCRVVEHMKFDARCVAGKYGIEVAKELPLQQFEDLHALNFLINPEDMTGNRLKQLAWEYTTEGGYEKGIGFVETLEEYDWEPNVHYNCHDSDLTRRIFALVKPRAASMKQDSVYELLLKPINCAALHMELDGVQMDHAYLTTQQIARKDEMDKALQTFRTSKDVAKLIQYCAQKLEVLAKATIGDDAKAKREHKQQVDHYSIIDAATVDITNTTLTILLYEVYGIAVTKKTDGDEPSTDADILEANSKKHPILKEVLAYKKAQKLYGTYISPYIDGKFTNGKIRKLDSPPHIKGDGKVHPTIKPTGARTGRSSMEAPNGQNIKNEYEAKRPFITRFVDGLLTAADYSQAEIRLAACQCRDPVLIRALHHDIHTINLAIIEKITSNAEAKRALSASESETVTFAVNCKNRLHELYSNRVKEQLEKEVASGARDRESLGGDTFKKALKFYEKTRRTIAKKFMFGPMYGQQERGIILQLIDEVGVPKAEAERDAPIFLAALKELYSVYFAWATSNVPEARATNYVESIFGRRRPLNYIGLLANRSNNDSEVRKQLAGLDRKVTNTKVQGPASDLCLLAGVHLIELFKNKRLSPKQELREKFINDALNGSFYAGCIAGGHITAPAFEDFVVKMLEGRALTRTVLPIHDSLTSDSPKEEVIPCAIMVDAVMSNTPRYYIDTAGVPFACELEIGPNLGDMKAFTI